jgi:type VI protein secretion system component Hcp
MFKKKGAAIMQSYLDCTRILCLVTLTLSGLLLCQQGTVLAQAAPTILVKVEGVQGTVTAPPNYVGWLGALETKHLMTQQPDARLGAGRPIHEPFLIIKEPDPSSERLLALAMKLQPIPRVTIDYVTPTFALVQRVTLDGVAIRRIAERWGTTGKLQEIALSYSAITWEAGLDKATWKIGPNK